MKIVLSFFSVEVDRDQAVSHKIPQWPFFRFYQDTSRVRGGLAVKRLNIST